MNSISNAFSRVEVLDIAKSVLSDGKPRKASQIIKEFHQRGIRVEKSLLNSVLHKEGRAYFNYDHTTYLHWRSEASKSSKELAEAKTKRKTVHRVFDNGLKAVLQDLGMRYIFMEVEEDSPAFFSVNCKGAELSVGLNSYHPFFKYLEDIFFSENEDGNEKPKHTLLKNAQLLVTLMLLSWARLESHQTNLKIQERYKDARQNWGRIARVFSQDRSNLNE